MILVATPTFGRCSTRPWELLRSVGTVVHPHETSLMPHDDLPHDELLARIPDAEAVIAGMDVINAEVLAAAPRLRVVAKHGVGLDTIDLAAARERDIRVVRAPGTNARAVAELAFGLMLAAARGIASSHRCVLAGEWPTSFGPELAGRTLGIVGFGAIGRILGDCSRAFGMTVLAHDPNVDETSCREHGARRVDFDECLAESDFLSLHLPAEPGSPPLLERAALAAMKPGAILINTARGEVVDEQALADALRQGHLAGAGVDVFSREPPAGNPLLNAPNVVLTSHLGACGSDANHDTGVAVAGDVVRVLSGEEPLRSVQSG